MTEFLSCRPNLEVDDLAPAAAFLRDVLGFEVEVDEPGMGLVLLRRNAVGLALVRSATPGSMPPPPPTSASLASMTYMSCAWPVARGSSPASLIIRGACATSWSRCPAATGWHSESRSRSLAYPGRRRERTARTGHLLVRGE